MNARFLPALILASGVLAVIGLAQQGPRAEGPGVGGAAPDFVLSPLNGGKSFKLSSNYGKRPTVLIFGSYT